MAQLQVRPLHDRILVRRLTEDDKTAGGIIIPDSAKEKPLEAEVIAVGEGKRNDAGEAIGLTVKVGDLILIGKYAGNEVKIDDVEHIILREEEVLAVVER